MGKRVNNDVMKAQFERDEYFQKHSPKTVFMSPILHQVSWLGFVGWLCWLVWFRWVGWLVGWLVGWFVSPE